jgi:Raf kinase inhibitor-like YbhB/YbcL family protein
MAMVLSSSAFSNGGTIPRLYTCDGRNLSPPLSWTGVPMQAKALLLLCEDPDAPKGVFRHWVAFGFRPSLDGLPEGAASSEAALGFRHAVNGFGRARYGGPCPPPGDRPHHYHYRLLALDRPLEVLAQAPTAEEVIAQAQPHVIASAELVGLYGR